MGARVGDMQQVGLTSVRNYWKARIAVPPEKGAWVWLLGPMAVGLAVAPYVSLDSMAVLVGAFAAYMLRQPATLAVKMAYRARSTGDVALVAAWCSIYATIAFSSATWLVIQRHIWVLALAVPGGVLFARHLWLVGRGDERHRMGMDIAAAGMLALTAPALLAVTGSQPVTIAIALWLVLWLQASASVVHMFLRLEQRKLKTAPSSRVCWTRGALPLIHHAINVLIAVALVHFGLTPPLVITAFLLAFTEGIVSIARPPVRATPKQLGMRQLAISSTFMFVVAVGYLAF